MIQPAGGMLRAKPGNRQPRGPCAAQDLNRLVYAYWQAHPPQNLYREQEAARFGAFLLAQLEQGALQNEFLEEIVQMELAVLTLATAAQDDAALAGAIGDPDKTLPCLRPTYRIAFFRHDPEPLLTALDRGQMPEQIQPGTYYLILSRSTDARLQFQQIHPYLGSIPTACDGQSSVADLCRQFALTVENVATLAEHGYICFRSGESA